MKKPLLKLLPIIILFAIALLAPKAVTMMVHPTLPSSTLPQIIPVEAQPTILASPALPSSAAIAQTSSPNPKILTIEHTVSHVTTVPGFVGETFQLAVREKVLSNLAETANGGAAGQVVVLVHGYSAPSVTTFDLDDQDYSWMNYLAERGFDTFALDLTGYGSSTRPAPMDNPCNLEPSEQRLLKLEPCEPTYPYTLTTLQSDWDDINAVVDYVQQLRGVTQVNLVGVSWGGARVLGYAATYPDKVDRIVVQGLAGAFSLRQSPDAPTDGLPMRISTQDELGDRWNPTIQCPDQVEPDMLNVVWHSLKASDPLGASWGMGVIRSPNFHPAGLTRNRVESITTPVLLVGGQHDNLASPWWMHRLYETLNTPDKVHMTLACTSHFISFETRKTFLYEASYDWFKNQSIAGRSQGSLTVEADDTYVWD